MELTTWHELAYQKLDKRAGHSIFSHLVMTPFYQSSNNEDDLGEYFGIGNDKNSFLVGQNSDFDAGNVDVDGGLLVHDYLPVLGATQVGGKVEFNPKQEIWGVRFDYFQSFGHPVCGLFFKASMPVVYVENEMDMDIANPNPETVGGKTFSLADFFAGKVSVDSTMDPAGENLQTNLKKAKITGEHSKFGVADVNLALGYKIHQTKKDHIFLSAQIIIPTGSRPNGEFLFQPVLGDGQHFGLGARLDGAIQLWSNKHAAIRVLLDADYRYLFESTEHRTLGVKGFEITPSEEGDYSSENKSNFAQYYLAGTVGAGSGAEPQTLFPAANILTKSIKVKPGSQFDLLADLSFKSGGFILNLGYNFFYKDEEDCWMKGEWKDDVYALVDRTYPTNIALDDPFILHTLNKADLDVSAVKTPSQVTNKIFAGLGYEFNYSKTVPGLVGIGGDYEFASENSALETYSVWVKLGVSF